jgi:hypothetical protein
VVTDGSRVLRQSSTGRGRDRAGRLDELDQRHGERADQADLVRRVQPQIALLGRVRSNTSYYYLALTASNSLVLGKRSSGTLDSAGERAVQCRRPGVSTPSRCA